MFGLTPKSDPKHCLRPCLGQFLDQKGLKPLPQTRVHTKNGVWVEVLGGEVRPLRTQRHGAFGTVVPTSPELPGSTATCPKLVEIVVGPLPRGGVCLQGWLVDFFPSNRHEAPVTATHRHISHLSFSMCAFSHSDKNCFGRRRYKG